jgi:hypothetical protein
MHHVLEVVLAPEKEQVFVIPDEGVGGGQE